MNVFTIIWAPIYEIVNEKNFVPFIIHTVKSEVPTITLYRSKSESNFPYFISAKLTILASCYFVIHWYVDPELLAGINNSAQNAGQA